MRARNRVSRIVPQAREVHLQEVLTLVPEDVMNAVGQGSVGKKPAPQIDDNTALPVGAPHRIVEAGPLAWQRVCGSDVFLCQRFDGSLAFGAHPALSIGTLSM